MMKSHTRLSKLHCLKYPVYDRSFHYQHKNNSPSDRSTILVDRVKVTLLFKILSGIDTNYKVRSLHYRCPSHYQDENKW